MARHPELFVRDLSMAEGQKHQSGKDLFANAALVVEGRITEQFRIVKMSPGSPENPADPKQNPQAGAPVDAKAPAPDPVVVTVRAIEVVRVFKGAATAGDKIEVKELGGQADGVAYRENEATPLQPAKTYALFLQTYPDAPASLLNSQQGKYLAGSSGVYSSMPGNEITLTRNELEALKNGK